jgi:HSP20 family molecular chaperone IbpA
MKIKDLIPFNWRRDKHPRAVPVAVTNEAPATQWPEFWPFGELSGHDTGIRVHIGEDCVRIEADLPGIAPEDIDLRIEDGQVIIRGERRETAGDSKRYCSIQRSVSLPAGTDPSQAKASQRNGVLELILPRVAVATAKRIPVQAG